MANKYVTFKIDNKISFVKSFSYYQYKNNLTNFLFKSENNEVINKNKKLDLFYKKQLASQKTFSDLCDLNEKTFNDYDFVNVSLDVDKLMDHINSQIKIIIKNDFLKLEKCLNSFYDDSNNFILKVSDLDSDNIMFVKEKYKKLFLNFNENYNALIKSDDKNYSSLYKRKLDKLKRSLEIIDFHNNKFLTFLNENDTCQNTNKVFYNNIASFSNNIKDFRKCIKHIFLYLKLNKNLLDEAFLILGKQNVASLILRFKNSFNINVDQLSYPFGERIFKNQNFKNNISKAQEVTSLLDEFTSLYDFIDLDQLFELESKHKCFVNEIDVDVNRFVFSKFSASPLSIIRLKNSIDENLIKQVNFVFNYYSLYIAYYRTLNEANIFSSVYDYVKNHKEYIARPSWPHVKFGINDVINISKNDNDNMFIYDRDIIFTSIQPIALLDAKINKQQIEISKVINHNSRYMALVNSDTLLTSLIYCSMSLYAHFLFREKVKKVDSNKFKFFRMFYIHNLIKDYCDGLSSYSSNALFSKKTGQKMFFDLLNAYHFKDVEKETESVCQNFWQEANITNGKNVPIIGLVVSIVSIIIGYFSFGALEEYSTTIKAIVLTAFGILALIFLIVLLLFPFNGSKSKR